MIMSNNEITREDLVLTINVMLELVLPENRGMLWDVSGLTDDVPYSEMKQAFEQIIEHFGHAVDQLDEAE